MQWIKQRNTHGESSSCKPVEKKKNMHAFTLEERRINNKIFQIRVGRRKCFFLKYKEINQGENNNTLN